MTEDTYRVVLFGHRDFDGHRVLDETLYPLIKKLMLTKPFVEIYIERNGEFDIYAATVIKRAQKAVESYNNEFICVLPYRGKNIDFYEQYYDSVIIPECVEKAHPKWAIKKRNLWMVKQADLFLCYVERNEGGAYTALKYAQSLKKEIINLADNKPAKK